MKEYLMPVSVPAACFLARIHSRKLQEKITPEERYPIAFFSEIKNFQNAFKIYCSNKK